jgi:predicted nucleic-acid-binding Zn-ribbon protein
VEPVKPYDPDSECPKCGAANAGSKWFGPDAPNVVNRKDYERILRACPRCEYTWYEEPLEKENP